MRNCLWVVEENWGVVGWIAWDDKARATRERARRLQRFTRKEDPSVPTRIRKYVRVDTSK